MPDFKIHLSGSLLSSFGISFLCFYGKTLNLTQALAIFIIGAVAGLFPDFDSDTGKPLTFLFQLISILIPSVFFLKATQYRGSSPEFIITYFTLSYLFINYIVCFIFKKITIHRGILHSIPFAILCGELGYLLFMASGDKVANIAGIAAFTGCFMHLLLDDFESFHFKAGFIPVIKRSNISAIKFRAKSLLHTIFLYLIVIILFIKIYFHYSMKDLYHFLNFIK